MAKDDLTGNMPTENLLTYFEELQLDLPLNKEAFLQSMIEADQVFPLPH